MEYGRFHSRLLLSIRNFWAWKKRCLRKILPIVRLRLFLYRFSSVVTMAYHTSLGNLKYTKSFHQGITNPPAPLWNRYARSWTGRRWWKMKTISWIWEYGEVSHLSQKGKKGESRYEKRQRAFFPIRWNLFQAPYGQQGRHEGESPTLPHGKTPETLPM